MVVSDPIADMLTAIRNGYLVNKKTVEIFHSQIKEKIGQILVKEGFLKKIEVKGKTPAEKKLVLSLKYQKGQPVLTGIKRISKPGQRIWVKKDKIPLVRLGFGVTIVSTPKGLMTNHEARKEKLGGEVICQVW